MSSNIERSFIIGEKWLYYKIYTGPNTADKILGEVLHPIADEMFKNKLIDKWFFIRYADPKQHLRIRFHVTDTNNLGNVIGFLTPGFKDLVKKDLVWKIQTDTYNRELERYGKTMISEAESIFFRDSVMICKLLSMIEDDEGEEIRWLFGLRAINDLLDNFHCSEDKKLYLLNSLKTNFRNEFSPSKILNNQLKDKYRSKRKKIEEFMDIDLSNAGDYLLLLDVLIEKSEQITPCVDAILNREEFEIDLDNLLASYIHMLMNRLFKSRNRIHEMVCYDFLHRYYLSSKARKKTSIAYQSL